VSRTALFQQKASLTPYELVPENLSTVVGQHHIFGSDPVSNEATELASLVPAPYARINSATAASLSLVNRGGVKCGDLQMTVLIDSQVADGCLVYPLIPATNMITGASLSDFVAIDDWHPVDDARQASIITSDGEN